LFAAGYIAVAAGQGVSVAGAAVAANVFVQTLFFGEIRDTDSVIAASAGGFVAGFAAGLAGGPASNVADPGIAAGVAITSLSGTLGAISAREVYETLSGATPPSAASELERIVWDLVINGLLAVASDLAGLDFNKQVEGTDSIGIGGDVLVETGGATINELLFIDVTPDALPGATIGNTGPATGAAASCSDCIPEIESTISYDVECIDWNPDGGCVEYDEVY